MASTKFFLDTRRFNKNNTAPLKIAIRNNNTTAYISTGISLLPGQWNAKENKVLNTYPGYQSLNILLSGQKGKIDVELLAISNEESIKNWSAVKLKNKLLSRINPDEKNSSKHTFAMAFDEFMSLKSESTKGVYRQTLARLNAYTNISALDYEDITPLWLTKFDNFLAKTAPKKNSRNIHMRNIRAVFNYAIECEYTKSYPFRRFKIRAESTRKRSLSIEEMKLLFNSEVEPYATIYIDIFKLMFMLIGINTIDLYNLKEISKGRIEYKRAKTGRLYSIKIEPEALEIINKYRGKNELLSITERWKDYRNFRKQTNKALQRIGSMQREGKGGKKIITPLFPELTTYWARHTWATIAAELDIPDAVISQALGHAGENSTTDIYILRNQKKVDEANRKVLDWVLYGKR